MPGQQSDEERLYDDPWEGAVSESQAAAEDRAGEFRPDDAASDDIGWEAGAWAPSSGTLSDASPERKAPFKPPDMGRFRSKGPVPPPDDWWKSEASRLQQFVLTDMSANVPAKATSDDMLRDDWELAEAPPPEQPGVAEEQPLPPGVGARETGKDTGSMNLMLGAMIGGESVGGMVGGMLGAAVGGAPGAAAGSVIGRFSEQMGMAYFGAAGKGYSQADLSSYIPNAQSSPIPNVDPLQVSRSIAQMAGHMAKVANTGVDTQQKRAQKL